MFKGIHYKTLIVWGTYEVITKGSLLTGFLGSVSSLNIYLINVLLSVIFGISFLFLFSHEDFFKFAKEIERKNSKQEKKWEHRLLHYGKFLSSFVIGIISGPLIAALAIRFLQPKSKYKYPLIILTSALSAFFWLWAARGVIIWRLPF